MPLNFQLMNRLNKLTKYERFFFLAVVVLNLIPILSHRFFPTIDGPAHLYNANLINHMLLNPDFDSFFRFNPEPVPNWIGHILLCFFNWFLPGYLAEKLLLLVYFIGLPYSFRNLIKSAGGEYVLLSYLIFPFTYNYLFSMGFYNFSLGLIGLFILLSFWIKNHETITSSIKKTVILSIFLILIYFSHVLMFSTALLAIACYTFATFLKQWIEGGKFEKVFMIHLKKVLVLLVSSLIPLVLMFFYFANRPDSENPGFLSKSELFSWLIYMNPLICYSFGVEKISTIITNIVLAGLIIGGLIIRVRTRKSSTCGNSIKSVLRINDVWLLMSAIMLLLLFIVPDKNDMASLISMRFAFLFFLFTVIWISTMKHSKRFALICSLLVLVAHVKRVRHLDPVIDSNNAIAMDCEETAKFIKPNSIVAPVNLRNHWSRENFFNYLGMDKPLIILENYEATMDYFPLLWNYEKFPDIQAGGISLAGNSFLSSAPINPQNQKKELDYIFVLGDWDRSNTEQLKTLQLISLHFTLIHKNTNCTLYRRKIPRK
ncbi:hypothetical protein Fluta_1664 [Fluviicola taffensis DSM 16823]|uniref:Glycosyltransferase RgtA/B/C/D-like domain-containing protein n=2 Tax=Fluviicola TaxID=332102 RepID=F2IGN9_FLUTR|nr:hypothetical protein Fluta_1664 [Fluviicola taffensis DSM 16823]